jgi:hypothetical protein
LLSLLGSGLLTPPSFVFDSLPCELKLIQAVVSGGYKQPGPSRRAKLGSLHLRQQQPIQFTDSTGQWVETAFDTASPVSLAMTINDIRKEGFTVMCQHQ